MTPLLQTYFYAGDDTEEIAGNCWQTCLASIMDKSLDEVPHFVWEDIKGGQNWWFASCVWMREQGYVLTYNQGQPEQDEYYMVSGKSPRGNWHHVVIYQNGKMVHDPHPDATGILDEEAIFLIRPLEN